MNQNISDIQPLLRACAAGDTKAQQYFQGEYGNDIYNFPSKIYRIAPEETGDFYVYVFAENRIFMRLRTFAGRNNIQFRTFLSFYVLKYLFLEWRRTPKEVETLSLQSPIHATANEDQTLEDVLPSLDPREEEAFDLRRESFVRHIWNSLSREEQLDSKLLSLLEYDLTPEDLRLLAHSSGRSLSDTCAVLAEVLAGLKKKDQHLSQLHDELDVVWGRILLLRRELQKLNERMRILREVGSPEQRAELWQRRAAVQHALAKRERQRQKIRNKMQTHKLTTPYKDIARLLNLSVGTVCSRMFRLRERLQEARAHGKDEGALP